MNTKKSIVIFIIILCNFSFGQHTRKTVQPNNLMRESQVDSIFEAKINIRLKPIKDSISKQNGINKLLKNEIEKYELKESLFSNQLSILTAIFSAIVAIAIFIIGYLVPKLTENKHKEELSNLQAEFRKVVEEIESTKKETKELDTKHDFLNAKLSFFSCMDSKFSIGTFLWALRYCSFYFAYQGDNADNEEVSYFINCAQDQLEEINSQKVHDLKIYLEEFNEIIKDLKPKLKEEDMKTLENIHQKFNEACWKNKKESEK